MTTPTRKMTMINGDGIGPEVCDAVRKVLEGAKAPLEYEYMDCGADASNKYGTNLPDETVASVMRNRQCLCCGSSEPAATGMRSGAPSPCGPRITFAYSR